MMEIQLKQTLRAGTRPSPLAKRQTQQIIDRLQEAWPHLHCETVSITTTGDRNLTQPLPEIGGKGVFTEQLEEALRSGHIDFAVHSLKDLPIIGGSNDLALTAIGAREDAHDVLISAQGWQLVSLPQRARVGTSSLRRAVQLKATRPDLTILPLRGNIDTRVRKALQGDYDAIVLAAAGLNRLGLEDRVTEYLPFELMLPAPGQAALALQSRAGDEGTRQLLAVIDDPLTRAAVTAERCFLKSLGGGCSAPVAAFAQHLSEPGGWLGMNGLVAASDGTWVIRVKGEGFDPEQLGIDLAQEALKKDAGILL
ncbi:MAG: hydroxymethylbilane synthase [Chloroflexi bacterium]|nr:hydroxymethylbilane synthase [Chloroflexota bacterium]